MTQTTSQGLHQADLGASASNDEVRSPDLSKEDNSQPNSGLGLGLAFLTLAAAVAAKFLARKFGSSEPEHREEMSTDLEPGVAEILRLQARDEQNALEQGGLEAQQIMRAQHQAANATFLSNMSKMKHDTAMAMINNIR